MGISEMLGFSSDGQKKEGDVKQVLEALTTTIESINVKLAGGTGGGNYSGLKVTLANMNKYLSSIYFSLNKIQAAESKLNDTTSDSFDDIKKTLQANFAKIDKEIQTVVSMNSAADNQMKQSLDILSTKVEDLVRVQMEQVEILKNLNDILDKKYGV
jgi:hypothetical protein